MKHKTSKALLATLAVPTLSFAHHGNEESLAGQLLHVSFDPLHLGISVLVALGLAGLAILRLKRDKAS